METVQSSSSSSTTPVVKSKKRRHMSAETRAKMSAAKKGKKMSDETKAKMSAAKKGKKMSDKTRAKMSRSHKATFRARTGFGRDQVNSIRQEYQARKTKDNPTGVKTTYQSLAEKYKVSVAYVYAILKNKVWPVRVAEAAVVGAVSEPETTSAE